MIDNNHIQLVMNVVRIHNRRKANAGKTYLSEEEMRKIESRFIKIGNYINKIENFFVNNRFSNWLKEELEYKMDYPLYIVSTEDQIDENDVKHTVEVYISDVKRVLQEDGKEAIELTVCYDPKFGMNVRKIKKRDRKRILEQLHKYFIGKTFEYKSILTVNAKMDTDVAVKA